MADEKKKKTIIFAQDPESLEKSEAGSLSPLMKALNTATGVANSKAPRLAMTQDYLPHNVYPGVWKVKSHLVPDDVIKSIRIQDSLVGAIVAARGSMFSLFGHLRKDRFDIGIEVVIKPEILKVLNTEQLLIIKERLKKFEYLLLNCGHTTGMETQDLMTLAEFLYTQGMNGVSFGRFATEVVYDRSVQPDSDGNYPFHRFRPIDVGTIRPAVRKGENVGDNLRETAIKLLEQMSGDKYDIDFGRLREDHYAWLQVVDELPKQAFTHKEMLVYTFYPSTDIAHNGYPVTPIDKTISNITTHINIDTYQELYFQNGRASKGMLVINSDEIDEATLNSIKLQFHASINSVSNSFRTPIFGITKDDSVQWLPLTGEGLGSEFAFMYDAVARTILASFSMSPDELPGYGHLSKGTNSQTLSESSNEFKLSASRDTGLRPLILKMQTFFNQMLMPLIDPGLAKVAEIRFAGLDAESKEKESARLQQDSALHMTYDALLNEVDKDAVGDIFGGNFPFNERVQLIFDKFMDAGQLREKFFSDPLASLDPILRYKRDPFWLQNFQLLMQSQSGAARAFLAPRSKELILDAMTMQITDMLDLEEEE